MNPGDSISELFHQLDNSLPIIGEEFDAELLPGFLWNFLVAWNMTTMVMTIFNLVFLLFIYRNIQDGKQFWRTVLGKLSARIDLAEPESEVSAMTDDDDDDESQREESQSQTKSFSSKPIEPCFKSQSFWNVFSSNLNSKVIWLLEQDRRMTTGHQNDDDDLDDLERNTWRTLFMLTDICNDRHECRMCSIEFNLNRWIYFRNVAYNFLLFLIHLPILFGLLLAHNQIVFYSTNLIYLLFGLTIVLSNIPGMMKKFNRLINASRQELCGYQRAVHLTETLLNLTMLVHFFASILIFFCYCVNDVFVKNTLYDLSSHMY